MPVSEAECEAHVAMLTERIGRKGPIIVQPIEEGALLKFARATGQTDPLYTDPASARAGPFGAIIAAPTYLSIFTSMTTEGSGLVVLDLPYTMFLHSDDSVEVYEPIRAGDTITAQATYHAVFRKNGRTGPMLFQTVEIGMVNQRGVDVGTIQISSVSFDAKVSA